MADEPTFNPNFALHQRIINGKSCHVSPADVKSAWRNQLHHRARTDFEGNRLLAAGYGHTGRLVEMIALDAGEHRDRLGNPLKVIYHANWATKKFVQEIGLPASMAEQ